MHHRTSTNKKTGKTYSRWHVGIDLYAYPGDHVIACDDGVIVQWKKFYTRANGEQCYKILIEHSNVTVNYGEVTSDSLSRLGLRVGDRIKAGQHIGFVSGTSMIHFETYVKGAKETFSWKKSRSKPSPTLLNPTRYLLYLQQHGNAGSGSFFGNLGSAIKQGTWTLTVKMAIANGERDVNKLTNMVFYAQNPQLPKGYKIKPGETALMNQWLSIRDRIVLPALK